MTDRQQDARLSGPTHTVRPRWGWAGLVVALAGLVVIAVGLVLGQLVVALVGVLLLAVGGVAAWRGNLFYDTHVTGTAVHPVEAIADDEVHEAPGASARYVDPVALEHARESSRTTRGLLAAPRPRADLWPVGVALVALVGLWLAVAQGVFSGSPDARGTSVRSLLVAVVLLLAAALLRLRGPHRLAWGACVVAGLFLLVSGTLLDHATAGARWSEWVSGVLVLAGCGLAAEKTRAVADAEG